MRAARSILFAATLAVLGSGCSVLGIDSGTEAELKDQRRAWLRQNITSYTYEFERLCFCMDVRPVIVTVEDDEITGIVIKESGEPVTQFLDLYYTIPALFDYLIDAAGRADEMEVFFDDARHIPVHVDIDFITNAADDELLLNLSNLVVTGS